MIYREWRYALIMKWNTFIYNYGWSEFVFLFDGWIAKCAMTVPIVGYLILFNDSASQHLSFNKLTGENAAGFGLASVVRLKLIYFGLIFLGSANILYRFRRPFILKISTNQFGYVERALSHFTVSDYIDIHGTIRHEGNHTLRGKYDDAEYDAFLSLATGETALVSHGRQSDSDWTQAKSKYEDLMRSMLIENFFRNNIKRRTSLTFCIFLSLFGYFLLLVPSADLFIKVLSERRSKAAQMKADDLYGALMNEARYRIEAINNLIDSQITPLPGIMRECCYLQLRMLCETIAMGCLVAHGDIVEPRKKSFEKEWAADKILKMLEALNPHYFPQQAVFRDRYVTANSNPNALTKQDLVKLYVKCGEQLHRGQVRKLRESNHPIELTKKDETDVIFWTQKIEDLLGSHLIPLSVSKTKSVMLICVLRDSAHNMKTTVLRVEMAPAQ